VSAKKQQTARKCEHCDMSFIVDAAGIKAHAEKCIHNPKNKVQK
jgi:hypothetical protein